MCKIYLRAQTQCITIKTTEILYDKFSAVCSTFYLRTQAFACRSILYAEHLSMLSPNWFNVSSWTGCPGEVAFFWKSPLCSNKQRRRLETNGRVCSLCSGSEADDMAVSYSGESARPVRSKNGSSWGCPEELSDVSARPSSGVHFLHWVLVSRGSITSGYSGNALLSESYEPKTHSTADAPTMSVLLPVWQTSALNHHSFLHNLINTSSF